jgi:predicted DNA-binding protein YlxM (UPF0122 family)
MISKEELYDLYWKKNWSGPNIARKLGVSKQTIYYWLRKNCIPLKSLSQALKGKHNSPNTEFKKKLDIEKDELYDLYWGKKLNMTQIARMKGCCPTAIRRWMRRYGIPFRSLSEETRLHPPRTVFKKGHKTHNKGKFKITVTKEQLQDLYWNQKLSLKQIAEKFGVAESCIWKHMKRLGVKTRKPWEAVSLSEEKIGKIRELACQGLTYRQIGKKLGIKHSTVLKYANKLGVSHDRSFALTTLWRNPIYARMILSSIHQKPTKPEKKVIDIIEHYHLPFIYVGNGKQIIGERCPDFISNNGKKKVIEVLGRLWHDPSKSFIKIPYCRTAEGIAEYYKKHGYDCLTLWEDELDEFQVLNRILQFIGGE